MGLNKLLAETAGLISTFNAKKDEISAAVTAAQTAVLANSKTYYVDPVAGLDTNGGTQAAPFKTIKKACDSVPLGGFGDVIIIGGADVVAEITTDIVIYNKIIQISSQTAVIPKLKNISYVSNGFKLTSGFFVKNSILSFINIHIVTASWTDATLTGSSEGIVKRIDASSCKLFVIGGKVSVSDTPFVKRPNGPAELCVGTYGIEVEVTGQFRQPGFAMLENMPAVLGFVSSILPAGTTWKQLIKGVTYHTATGLPINVISNVDLSSTPA